MTEPHDDPAAQDVADLRSEIAGTRAEMDETISEIEQRLDPRNVVQQQTARLREQLDSVPVAAIAGGGGGLAALGTVTTVARRRRAQARLEQQQREQTAGGVVGLGALVAALGVVRALRARRRRRRTVTVQQVMSRDVAKVAPTDTLAAAAGQMARLGIGAVPVCGPDDHLEGMLTDRDIVVKAVARGDDPRVVTAASVATRDVVTIGAHEPVSTARDAMSRAAVRRLPVVEGSRVVGVLSQADLAVHLDDAPVGDLVEEISAAPADR